MNDDRDIRNAIKAGERNREVAELIHNWCKHARVEKFGGTGLIEMETGLPIGHHSMACDYAPAGGMATWDLADAALDFYDRNCAGCTFRNPRRLPNLTQLIRQRDEARERAERHRKQIAEEQAHAFARRQSQRDELRRLVPSESVTILEQLEELDRDPTNARCEQLVQTAKLAPEIFSTEILEHLFLLLEAGEGWFTEAGLRTLTVLNADPVRLARCALVALARGFSAAEAAGEILVAHTAVVDPSLIPGALRALVLLAHPPRSPFSVPERRAPIQEPLLTLYRSYPDAINSGIHQLLEDRQPELLNAGANAISVIHSIDHTVSAPFVRSIVAVLARAETVVDFDERFGRTQADELYADLERALTLALGTAPAATDEVVGRFIDTTRSEGQARILRAYQALFHTGFRDKSIRETEAHTVALKRLVEIASTAQDYKVLMELLDLFRHDVPQGLEALVRRELPHLIGMAVLLDARRESFSVEARASKDCLESMEKGNLESLVNQLQKGLVKWCASAAADDRKATKAYIEVLRGVSETQEDVRAIMVTALGELMVTAEGLNAALPPLYTALVGTSQRLRAAALAVFSKLARVRRADLPDLLYEALMLSLLDPYVIVHQTAVRSIERCDVPETFRPAVSGALLNLILAYSHDKQEHGDEFLMTCISLYVSRYATDKEVRGDLGALFVSQMRHMDPRIVIEELGWWHKKLAPALGFGAMAVKLLEASRSEGPEGRTVRVLRSLDSSAIYAERKSLEGIALGRPEDRDLTAIAVELLTGSGAWSEAANVARVAFDAIEDTIRNKPRRLFMNLLHISTAYEMAVASGSLAELPSLEQQWHATEEALEKDRKENEKQRGPFLGFPSADYGE